MYRIMGIFFIFFFFFYYFLLDVHYLIVNDRVNGIKWEIVGNSGMKLLTGEFRVTLDEKGRISLPAGLRKDIDDPTLRITKGEDNCLWLFPSAKWEELVSTKIAENTDPFSRKDRSLLRRLIGPSQEIEIDKAGRIPIAQSLREFAGLSKDCMVLGQIDYIEIWDESRYFKYLESSGDEFEAASEELSGRIKRKRGID